MDSYRKLFTVVGLAVALIMAFAGSAHASHVSPTLATDPATGQPYTSNVTCAQLGLAPLELKVEPVSDTTKSASGLTINLDQRSQVFDWTATAGSVDAVLVKGGTMTNVYSYSPESTGDTGLHAPTTNSGSQAGLSHVSFCYDLEVDISGRKYVDANADGQTIGDGGWDGVTIKLDPGTPGDASDDIPDVTSGGGYYSFDDLAPGVAYRVYEVTPSGSTCSLPSNQTETLPCRRAWSASDAVGNAHLTQDFANWRPVSISGTKYVDTDEDLETDGVDGTEATLANVRIWLDPGTPTVAGDDTYDDTDADGDYSFSGLRPGVSYRVYETAPTGTVCRYPTNTSCSWTFSDTVSGGSHSGDFANFDPNPGITIDKQLGVGDDLVHIGDQIDYDIVVSNTGNTTLDVDLTDYIPGTTDPVLAGCDFGDQSLEFSLAPGAQTTLECSAAAPDADSYTNKACVDASDAFGSRLVGEDYCDDVTTEIIDPKITVTKKVTPTVAHAGDVLTYEIKVKNTSDDTYLDVSMTDFEKGTEVAGCTFTEDVSAAFRLAAGAERTFTCTKAAPDKASYVNEVCVVGVDMLGGDKGTVGDDPTVCADDSTTIIKPDIDVTKSVDKATARVGETLTYTIVVSNPSNTDLVKVDMTDVEKGTAAAGCAFPPGTSTTFALAAKSSTQFTCTKAMPDQEAYVNEVCVSGVDMIGGPKGSVGPECAEAATTVVRDPAPLVEPEQEEPGQVVLGERIAPGAARLLGPTGCRGSAFRARVAGTKVARVVYTLDGKRLSTLTKPNFRGQFAVRINPAKLKVGVHRLTAVVTFERGSGTRPKTMRLSFQRCARALQAPRFTG